jgi:hypothetical protein
MTSSWKSRFTTIPDGQVCCTRPSSEKGSPDGIRTPGVPVARRVPSAIPDDEFDDFIDRFARRVAAFDRQGLMDIKSSSTSSHCQMMKNFPHRWTHYGKR